MNKLALLTTALIGLTDLASAHEGHGLPGTSHWHAEDAAMFVLAAGVGLAVWLWRSK